MIRTNKKKSSAHWSDTVTKGMTGASIEMLRYHDWAFCTVNAQFMDWGLGKKKTKKKERGTKTSTELHKVSQAWKNVFHNFNFILQWQISQICHDWVLPPPAPLNVKEAFEKHRSRSNRKNGRAKLTSFRVSAGKQHSACSCSNINMQVRRNVWRPRCSCKSVAVSLTTHLDWYRYALD